MKGDRVSVHGGHSAEFCSHAEGTLEEVVCAYIEKKFVWVGITEHIPPVNESFLYPDEVKAGLTVRAMEDRFAAYMTECRRLQKKYRDEIILYVGMEIETCTGSEDHVSTLIERYSPDYIVGSVHHVLDIPFDYSQKEYERARRRCGSLEALYCTYFDAQYAMIRTFAPAVVGHFDLIRIYDENYRDTLQVTSVQQCIKRNLDLIAELGLILDYNLRALSKGAQEPYVSMSIFPLIQARNIRIVPGDDSHGAGSVGEHMDDVILNLEKAGFITDWTRPC